MTSESPAPMSMKKRLVISALFGVGIPVLSLIVVSFTDDHSAPTLFRSVAEGAANVAFSPATILLPHGFFNQAEASLNLLTTSLSTILLFGIPAAVLTTAVFALSLIWRSVRRRIVPHAAVS